MMVACSESGNEKHPEPLSGPHSEIYIQYESDGIQPYQMEANHGLNENLMRLLQSSSIIGNALVKTGIKDSDQEIMSIKERLSFENVENTDLLKIHFYEEDEKFANAFLRNMVEALSEDLLEEAYTKSSNEMEAVMEEMDSVKVQLIKLEEKIVNDPNLLKDLERQQTIYIHLLEQRSTLAIEKAGIVNPIKILDGPIYKVK